MDPETITTPHVDSVRRLDLGNIQITLSAVLGEVLRQEALARQGKFGDTHILPGGPDHARLGVLMEEVGEVARELNEGMMRGTRLIDKDALVKELIQVGACAVAWATALESP